MIGWWFAGGEAAPQASPTAVRDIGDVYRTPAELGSLAGRLPQAIDQLARGIRRADGRPLQSDDPSAMLPES